MNTEKEIVCGADIQREFLVATMISRSGLKLQEQFGMDQDGLLAFRSWIPDHRCQRVAVESTGNYWYPIFCILDGYVEFILADAFQIRNIEGKKTDRLDSERIAIYCLNDLIKPSGIYPKDCRELRSITRSREALVNARSKTKKSSKLKRFFQRVFKRSWKKNVAANSTCQKSAVHYLITCL
jgi:transposase